MRKHLLLFIAIFAFAFGAQAQMTMPSVKIAFEKTSRDSLFIYDGMTTVTLLSGSAIVKPKNLAVLAATNDGRSIMIGVKFYFPKTVDPTKIDSLSAIARVDSPFVIKSLADFKLLKAVTLNVVKPLPLGALSADGKQWFATWVSSAPGQPEFILYHGNFDGTGAVDQVQLPNDNSHLIGDFHMSNIAVNQDVNAPTMIAVTVDKLTSSTEFNRYQLIRWQPNPPIGTLGFGKKEFTSQVRQVNNTQFLDSAMGFALRTIPGSSNAEMVFATNSNNDLATYIFSYNFTDALKLTRGRDIPRSVLPDTLNFFAGYGADVINTAGQRGSGGDMMFSPGGDSVVFVTHEANEEVQTNRGTTSSVWIYDFNSGQASLIYNDPARQETQPIFLPVPPPPAPEKPGYVETSVNSVDFGTIVVGVEATKSVTISNPSGKDVKVNSVTIEGAGAAQYKITSGKTSDFLLNLNGTAVYTIQYTARTQGSPNADQATLVVRFADSPDSLRTVTLTGKTMDSVLKGVEIRNQLAISVAPNPFVSSISVHFPSSVASGSLKLVDMLGRTVVTSQVAGGSIESSLHVSSLIPNGVYYIVAEADGSTTTARVVLQR